MSGGGGMPNGTLIMGQMHQLKKIPPQEKIAYEDPRSDLMKAIRDGELGFFDAKVSKRSKNFLSRNQTAQGGAEERRQG